MTGDGTYSLIVSASILLLTAYLTFISYALIGKHKLMTIPVHTIRLAFREMYPLLPMFVLFFAAVAILIVTAISNYLHITSARFGMLTLYNIIGLAAMLTITVLLKETLKRIIYEKNSL